MVELPYANIGVPSAGLSIVANDGLIQRDPRAVEGFVRASLRGWDAARRSPERAARAVLDQFLADYEGQIVSQLQSELPWLCGSNNAVIGMPSAAGWRATAAVYVDARLLAAPPSTETFVTPRFIGGSAPGCPQ